MPERTKAWDSGLFIVFQMIHIQLKKGRKPKKINKLQRNACIFSYIECSDVYKKIFAIFF